MNTSTKDRALTIRHYAALLLLVATATATILCFGIGVARLLGIHLPFDRLLPDHSGLVLVAVAALGMWGFPHLTESLKSWAGRRG
jgi:hypothetical protein